MKRLLAAIVAGMFAFAVTSPVIAQDQKKAQMDKGTPAQGTVQKKDQTKAKADTKKKSTTKSKADTKKKTTTKSKADTKKKAAEPK
jgi:hypothetical protein